MPITRHNRLGAVLVVLICSSLVRAANDGPVIRAVRLEPSFWNYSGFSSPAAGGDRAKPVGQYEKLELYIDLDAVYSNPYDPGQIDLWTEFTSPSGKPWRIWGFYHPSSATSLWMVRFAPTEVGTWRYVVKVRDARGLTASPGGAFEAVPSSHHGFVTIAPNQRYLRYSDGASFYGVGLWYNDHYHFSNRGNITTAGLDELKKRGANFISFFLSPLETLGSGLGRYDQELCARLDQVFRWCEERDLHVSMNVWFHNYMSETVWAGEKQAHSWYRHNPYRLVAKAADLFKGGEAWQHQEKLHRYIIARWGYSRALFLWFVVDEINGTDGWVQGDRAVAEEWCRKVHNFFREHDPYRRPTTGTQSGGIKQWWPEGYRIFDIAARELYETQGHPMPAPGKLDAQNENPLQLSYKNYARQSRDLWRGFAKPAMIAECGWDHTYYEPGMPGYLAMYHNALWAGLANGLCATPFWWAYMDGLKSEASFSDRLNDSVLTSQMLNFSRFVADIDFANLSWEPAQITAGACDAWAMKSEKLVFGWVVNPKTSLAGELVTLAGLNDGNYEVRVFLPWRGSYLEPLLVPCRDGRLSVTIPELKARSHAAHIGHDVALKIVPRAR